jgi:hypothetical protein
MGPIYRVTRTKPHFITRASGLLRNWSTATYKAESRAMPSPEVNHDVDGLKYHVHPGGWARDSSDAPGRDNAAPLRVELVVTMMHLAIHGVSTFQQGGPDAEEDGHAHRCLATIGAFQCARYQVYRPARPNP